MRPTEIRPGIRRLFRLAVWRRDRVAQDMDDEIRLHLHLRAEQLVREGLSPDEARAEAERRFGPLGETRERLHGSAASKEDRLRLREWAIGVAHGLRVSLRGLRRAPAFAVTVVACVALGVGANAAAYSMFEELLLRPLPVHDPARLVSLGAPGPKPGGDQCNWSGGCEEVFSYPMVRDLMRARTDFSGIAAHRLFIANLAFGSEASTADGVFVSGSYFPVLGLRPAIGRLLAPADDRTLGAHPVAVLSHGYWTTELGADPAVVGKSILVNGKLLTIVGVAPSGFEGTTIGIRPRVYVPLAMTADVDPFFGPRSEMERRNRYWVYAFARLQPGTSIERARGTVNAVYRAILADVDAPLQQGMSAATMARFKAKEVTVVDGRHGQSILHGATRTPLVLLLAITGVVVLIACANIANLLLARGATRGTEIAVRLSLGAGRRQVVAQLLAESSLLAALGGIASIAVAWATLRLIGSFIPPAMLGMGTALSLELRPSVLAFAAATALGTGLLFGLFPALHATRPDLIATIRSGAGQIAGGQRTAARFRATLVTAQIALSMALLGSAGLLIRSLRNVGRVDLGLDVGRVAFFALLPDLNGYDRARSRALFDRAEDEIAALPGVQGIAGATTPLLTGSSNGGNVRVQGFARGPDTDANTRMNQIGPDFFKVFGIPMLAGRDFTRADRMGAPKVAIVSEAFAKKFGLGRDAVGKRLAVDDATSGPLDVEIVGLVRDAGYSDVKGGVPPLLYTPYRQDSTVGALAYYVRSSGSPEGVLPAIRASVGRVDRGLPVAILKTMTQQARENVYLDRMLGTLAAGFAGLATLLAAVGLYGVLSYTVAQRTREIGVRMALGASERSVRAMVLRQVGRMTLAGGALGVAAALGLGRAARSVLFGLQGHDPVAVAAAAVVLAAVALAAGWLPAWRAARVNPTSALRGD